MNCAEVLAHDSIHGFALVYFGNEIYGPKGILRRALFFHARTPVAAYRMAGSGLQFGF